MSLAYRSVALVLCGVASGVVSVAYAHAPLPRGLAVARDTGTIAVRMPGFGWLLQDSGSFGSEPGFAYACDALVGVSPFEEHAPMAYRNDGTLLVGSEHGLRMLDPKGCPSSKTPLSGLPVTAVAVHPAAADRVYAVTEVIDVPPAVQRSEDGGESWSLGAQLSPYPVSALVLDASDPDTLYVSQKTGARRSSVAVSHDGGESFESFPQDRELTLLYAQAEPTRLWAVQRVPNTPVGWVILRAAQPEGPWQELLTVNFFGGFAVDPNDAEVIWVGDEARGVFRSDDGGDSFEETQPSIASACLAYGADALWSCTPDLPERTALVRSSDAIEPFDPIMAFADVDHLVDCGPALDVAQVCERAWIEWQRDVLGQTPVLPDAGAIDQADAATASDAEVAVEVDAGTMKDAGSAPAPHRDTGCAVIGPRSTPTLGDDFARYGSFALAALGLIVRAFARRSRRSRR